MLPALLLLHFGCGGRDREVVVDYISPDDLVNPVVVLARGEVRTPYVLTPGNVDGPPQGPNLYNPNSGLEQITLRWTTGGRPYVIWENTYQWGSAAKILAERARRAWKRNPPDRVNR